MSRATSPSPVLSVENEPIVFEVVRSSLVNLVSEMGVRLARVAFSPVIADGRDYSLAMCAANGDMICTGPMDLPAHIGTLEFTARCVIEKFPIETIEPGDIFFLNEPHAGGTHNNDMRVVYPVFVEDELLVWLIACGHWADVGGPLPGSFNANATSCFAEGIRVPPVRIARRGEPLDDVVDVILGNVRLYHQSKGDLQAAIESCRAGERRLHEIVAKHGAPTVSWALREMMDHSERLLLSATKQLPDGVYEWTDWVDVDLPAPDPQPYKVHLRMEVRDGELTFDYRGSDPQPIGPSGSSLPMTWSATVCGVLNMFPGIPINHGVIRNLHVVTTPATCVDVQFPGAICGTAAGVYEKVLASVLNCIGQADPERRTAATYNLVNVTTGGSTDDGRLWVMYLWPSGGFGATARGDGGLPSMMLFSAGSRNQPVEVLERAFPIVFERMSMKQDSGGAGRYIGGPGEERVFRITEGRAELTAIGDRNRFPIWGVNGGAPGAGQDILLDPGEEHARALTVNVSGERLAIGQLVHLWTGGGGGYGDPLDRPPEEVLSDVIDELVSLEAAANEFGVVIRPVDPDVFDYHIDEQETAARREAMRRERAEREPEDAGGEVRA